MVEEKRKSERHRVRFHLVYDDGSSFNAGTVRDVSEGGLFLETAISVGIGTEVKLTPLDTAGTNIFDVTATVVRIVPYDEETHEQNVAGMGVEFVDLELPERTKVVAMIRELEEEVAHSDGTLDPYLGVRVPTANPNVADETTD